MSKFSIGEKVHVIGYITGGIHEGIITDLPGKFPLGSYCLNIPKLDLHDCYNVSICGSFYPEPEYLLRKLPPDNNVLTRETTEEPGLTRLKKLLEQDVAKHKENINV